MIQIPWVYGPKELLQHAESHLNIKDRTAFDLRIAMISVDNSVEVMIKTYLTLPKRLLGFEVNELYNKHINFVPLLELLDKYAKNKTVGIELEYLEWFHKLRNILYHSPNGISVDVQQIEIYFKIATTLYENLFGVAYESKLENTSSNIDLIQKLTDIERAIMDLAVENGLEETPQNVVSQLVEAKLVDNDFVNKYDKFVAHRNLVVHGGDNSNVSSTSENTEINELTVNIKKRDFTKYEFNGEVYAKNRLVLAVLKYYVEQNPNLTYKDLETDFPRNLQGTLGVFTKEERAKEISLTSGDRYFMKPSELIVLQDSTIAVCSQWGVLNLPSFLKKCQEKGIKIKQA